MVVAQLERAITIAQALQQGLKLVKSLRKDGNNVAATALERECNKLATKIRTRRRNSNQSARRASGASRGPNGRFL